MKKRQIGALLLSLLLWGFPLMAGAQSAAPADFSVEWKGEAPALTAVASWTCDGDRYEMVVNGLKSKLSSGKLSALAEAFCARENAVLTDPALTDAEKFTHFLPHRAGDPETWVVTDEVRSEERWGDSLQCWAASAANMLTAAGWTALAKDPQTGATFRDEDAVFSYLTACFFNEGDFQENGVQWFFAGEAKDEAALREEAVRKKMLTDDPGPYLTSMFAEDAGASAAADMADLALALKKRASLGIAISFHSTAYRLLADPAVEVTEENGRYTETDFIFLTGDEYLELPEHDWTFDADGGVIVLEKTGGTYRDKNGKEYPAMSVKRDHLFQDAATGEFFLPERMDSSGVYSILRTVTHAAEEVDLAHPIVRRSLGNGEHALTVSGYIRNVSRSSDDLRGIRAMLIADSDNDANIWQIDADTTIKEDRPNTYTLCYTQTADVDGTAAIDLTNYLDNGTACIAYACLLYPREELTVTITPGEARVKVGEQATFKVKAQEKSLKYQWYVDRHDDKGWQALKGATGTSYTTAAVEQKNDGYRYKCVAKSPDGRSGESNIAVLHVGTGPVPPTGDNNRTLLWLTLLTVSGVALFCAGRKKRQYR